MNADVTPAPCSRKKFILLIGKIMFNRINLWAKILTLLIFTHPLASFPQQRSITIPANSVNTGGTAVSAIPKQADYASSIAYLEETSRVAWTLRRKGETRCEKSSTIKSVQVCAKIDDSGNFIYWYKNNSVTASGPGGTESVYIGKIKVAGTHDSCEKRENYISATATPSYWGEEDKRIGRASNWQLVISESYIASPGCGST